jgi:hypothetical protein
MAPKINNVFSDENCLSRFTDSFAVYILDLTTKKGQLVILALEKELNMELFRVWIPVRPEFT